MVTEVTDKMKNKISNELKIAVLEKKVSDLEKKFEKFMGIRSLKYKRERDERDRRWDEMVTSLTDSRGKMNKNLHM